MIYRDLNGNMIISWLFHGNIVDPPGDLGVFLSPSNSPVGFFRLVFPRLEIFVCNVSVLVPLFTGNPTWLWTMDQNQFCTCFYHSLWWMNVHFGRKNIGKPRKNWPVVGSGKSPAPWAGVEVIEGWMKGEGWRVKGDPTPIYGHNDGASDIG